LAAGKRRNIEPDVAERVVSKQTLVKDLKLELGAAE
jgi:hypothetical protein